MPDRAIQNGIVNASADVAYLDTICMDCQADRDPVRLARLDVASHGVDDCANTRSTFAAMTRMILDI
jgi:hypothetical protein